MHSTALYFCMKFPRGFYNCMIDNLIYMSVIYSGSTVYQFVINLSFLCQLSVSLGPLGNWE